MSLWVGGVEVTNASGVYVGGTLCEGVYVGATKVWPTFNPVQVGPFSTATGSYTTPVGATKCDVVVFGAGAGGDSGGAGQRTGYGGLPGNKNGGTINVTSGQVISWNVGTGGAGGYGTITGTPPTNGGQTSCAGVVAAGGVARTAGTGQDPTGIGTGDYTFNGRVYPGSVSTPGTQNSPGLPGNAPGGGGGGGKGVISGFVTGGSGANGCVYLYFYN